LPCRASGFVQRRTESTGIQNDRPRLQTILSQSGNIQGRRNPRILHQVGGGHPGNHLRREHGTPEPTQTSARNCRTREAEKTPSRGKSNHRPIPQEYRVRLLRHDRQHGGRRDPPQIRTNERFAVARL